MERSRANSTLVEVAQDVPRMDGLHEILGEFCHKHRNRLNNIRLGLYLVRELSPGSGIDWTGCDDAYQRLEQVISRVHSLCRPIQLTPIRFDLAALFSDRRLIWSDLGLRITWDEPRSKVELPYDPTRLGEVLDAWVARRAGLGVLSAEVRWQEEGSDAIWEWIEGRDSPPIDPEDLSLALVARVVSVHGGAVSVSGSGARGGSVVARLPRD